MTEGFISSIGGRVGQYYAGIAPCDDGRRLRGELIDAQRGADIIASGIGVDLESNEGL